MMNTTDDRIHELEDEVRKLKAQLEGNREKELLDALAKMPDGTLYRSVRDTKTGILRYDYLSGTWEKMSGVTIEDTLADVENIFANVHPEDVPKLKQHINEAHQKLINIKFDFRYNHPVDKKQYWYNMNSYPYVEGDLIYSYGFIFDITARKEVEQKLIAEKERLETLNNNLPDGALFQFVLETNTGQMRVSYVSDKWENLTGIPTGTITNSLDIFFAMIHPDDLPLIMQSIDKSSQTMEPFFTEFRVTVRGQTRWMQSRSNPYRRGSSIIWDGIMLDVTPRKEAVHALETERLRLKALGDNLPGSTLCQFSRNIRTGQIRLLYASGTWETVLGFPAEEVIKDVSKLFDATDPDHLPLIIQAIGDSARTMTDHIFESRINNRWISVVARPRSEGILVIWDAIMTNITDRKETEKQLEVEKKRLQMLSDNLHNSALYQFVRDNNTRQMRLSFVSGTWEDVTGIPAETALDDVTKVFSAMPAEDFPTFLKSIDDSSKSMSVHKYEIRFGNRWMRVVSRPRNGDQFTTWDGIITDITEQKENEAELQQYREQLEYLVKERTDELNTTNEELMSSNEELYATNEELDNYKTRLEELVQVKTEELLVEKKRLQAIADNMPDGYLHRLRIKASILLQHDAVTEWVKHIELVYASGNWEKLSGIPLADAMRNFATAFDVFHPEDDRGFLPELFDCVTNRKPFELEHRWLRAENDIRWRRLTLWFFDEDEWVYFDGLSIDITNHKLAEIELAKYRDNLELLIQERTNELNATNKKMSELIAAHEYQLVRTNLVIQASRIGLWDMLVVKDDPINPNNNFVWSDEFRKMLGYSNVKDFPNILRSWSDKLHPDDKKRTLDAFANHLNDRSGQTPYDIEYRLLKKNGEYTRFRAYGATVRDKDGYPVRVAGAIKKI